MSAPISLAFALIDLADKIGASLDPDYVHIDEDAEAETAPGAWTERDVFGITVVRRSHDRLGRVDVPEQRQGAWGVALLRRLDPVPELG